MIRVGNYFETKEGLLGIVVMLIGSPVREIYGDMGPPGADSGYEYVTLFVPEYLRYGKAKVQLMPLNRYAVEDVIKLSKKQYDSRIRNYWKSVHRATGYKKGKRK